MLNISSSVTGSRPVLCQKDCNPFKQALLFNLFFISKIVTIPEPAIQYQCKKKRREILCTSFNTTTKRQKLLGPLVKKKRNYNAPSDCRTVFLSIFCTFNTIDCIINGDCIVINTCYLMITICFRLDQKIAASVFCIFSKLLTNSAAPILTKCIKVLIFLTTLFYFCSWSLMN